MSIDGQQVENCENALDQDDISESNAKQFFTLNDLFNLVGEQTENNVYEIIGNVNTNKQNGLKYVQVHRKVVETKFSKLEVLQLVDISEKILYEMAVGQKRLLSLINVTVSHDMRNPTNSIQVQV